MLEAVLLSGSSGAGEYSLYNDIFVLPFSDLWQVSGHIAPIK